MFIDATADDKQALSKIMDKLGHVNSVMIIVD